MDDQAEWRARRDQAVAQHALAEQRQRAAETERARELVRRFAAEAGARGLRTTALTAFAYDGGGRYRTGLRGWYLQRARTLAVTPDGTFYVLGVPASLRARLTGAQVPPADPPLIVGRGARDGESMPLEQLLRQRLKAGDDWA
ncbi:hypothetical protein CS0771_26000 [Catellatospora sp. IY07-71]|uniref:hypothetical protein n=1 Tax=Catellatospora sp. IY07-71 TaxID=2728827 RepID=UPI001BB3FDDF|nr:hypothetical protein [Catellatospora sp. IY07-71]BCJ73056.1 hypothetical protein CS0771_26000 [Catellatospora sp. IY07-71]